MSSDVKEKTIKSVQNGELKSQQRAGKMAQQLRLFSNGFLDHAARTNSEEVWLQNI